MPLSRWYVIAALGAGIGVGAYKATAIALAQDTIATFRTYLVYILSFAAAWVGRPLGKHKINLWFADHEKSWEGSLAMAATAFAACLVSLVLLSPYSPIQAVLISIAVAITSSLSEMASKGGIDTITVPCANVLVLWLISLL